MAKASEDCRPACEYKEGQARYIHRASIIAKRTVVVKVIRTIEPSISGGFFYGKN